MQLEDDISLIALADFVFQLAEYLTLNVLIDLLLVIAALLQPVE